jgi:hypothetical protein
VNVAYESGNGESKKQTFELDLLPLVGMVQLRTPPLKTMSDNLKALQSDVHHVTTGFKRLTVNVNTRAEVEAEEADQIAEFHRRKAERDKEAV